MCKAKVKVNDIRTHVTGLLMRDGGPRPAGKTVPFYGGSLLTACVYNTQPRHCFHGVISITKERQFDRVNGIRNKEQLPVKVLREPFASCWPTKRNG